MCFGRAEIFHGLGHLDAKLFAKEEEGVDGMARGEDDSGVVKNVQPLGTEFPGGQRLDEIEWTEVNLYAEFLFHSIVGSLVHGGGLRYQNLAYVHKSCQKMRADATSNPAGKISSAQRYKNAVN